MELELKSYQTVKAKHYLKNNITFLINSQNQDSKDVISIEQHLKNQKYNRYKTPTKIITKILKNSIFLVSSSISKSNIFMLKPNKQKKKIDFLAITFNFIKQFFFVLLSIKLNNKIYVITQINKINSFCYNNNKLIMYQLNLTKTKFLYNLKLHLNTNSE